MTQETSHFRDVLAMQSLGLVLTNEIKPNTTKAGFYQKKLTII